MANKKALKAFNGTRVIGALILGLLFITALNTYFNVQGFPKFQLCTINCTAQNYPTNPFYNPSAGQTTFNSQDRVNGVASTIVNINCQLPGGGTFLIITPQSQCLFNANTGLLSVPVGMYADNVGVPYTICPVVTCFPSASVTGAFFGVKVPGGISDACAGITSGQCQDSSGFDLKTGLTGSPFLLDPTKCPNGVCLNDPTCTGFGGATGDAKNSPNTCWQQDVSIIQQAQSVNPPCIQGVTVCITNTPKFQTAQNVTLTNPVNGTTTFVNPFNGQVKTYYGYTYTGSNCPAQYLSGTNCVVQIKVLPTAQKVWYVYRMITSLTLQIVPPAVVPYCVSAQSNNNYCNGPPSCSLGFQCTWNPSGTLSAWAPSIVTNMNKISTLTNTQIAFGVTVPPQAALTCSTTDIQSGNCWWGIIGLWVGGQGYQTAGCAATSATCSFSIGTSAPHSQLPLYSCPQMTSACVATLPLPNILTGLATASNQTVASVIAANSYPQVFSYLNTQNFGVQYACTGGPSCPSCTPSTLASCIITPTNLVVNVPLIFDVLGTQQLANWLYQYPAIPPVGGPLTGNIFGKITDTSGNPIAAACVSINNLCSFSGAQYQRSTSPAGLYSFSSANIPAGTYGVYASAPGYVSNFAQGITIAVGGSVEVDLSLTVIPQPPSQLCLIPPLQIPSVNPFSPPTYTPGILCLPPIPAYVLPAILILTGLGLVLLIFITPAGSALTLSGIGAAGALGGLLRRRK